MSADRHPQVGRAPAAAGPAAGDPQALPLFAYGTLTDGRLLRRVAGARLGRPVPARLPGHAVRAVRGQPFPALVAEPRASARGVLWPALPAGAWSRLDRYEGDWYRRAALEVLPAGGPPTRAWVYLWRGPRRLLAGRWRATPARSLGAIPGGSPP